MFKSNEAGYSIPSQKTIEAFNKSSNQKVISKLDGNDVVIGDFGRNNQNKKIELNKLDRFPEKELPETIKNVVNKYKASNNTKSYRFDNIALHSIMPNGESRIVYIRKNRLGQDEIIN